MTKTVAPKGIDKYSIQLVTVKGLGPELLRYIYPEKYLYVNTHEVRGKNLHIWKYDIMKDGTDFYREFDIPLKNVDYILEEVINGPMRYKRKARFNAQTGVFSVLQTSQPVMEPVTRDLEEEVG